MDYNLISDSNINTLERMFEVVKKVLPNGDYKLLLKNIQSGDSVSYLGYRIDLQKIREQKAQIRRDCLQTLKRFQRLLRDIFRLQPAVGITPDLIMHLNKTLGGDKDLSSPR